MSAQTPTTDEATQLAIRTYRGIELGLGQADLVAAIAAKLAGSHSQRPVIEVLALARHAMPTAAEQYADYVADKS